MNRSDGYIEPRDVQLGARVGDNFVVLKGLKAGEEVVTSANFIDSKVSLPLGSLPTPRARAAADECPRTPSQPLT